MNILEVCVDSVESALQAKKGGANRIELCANLIIGGTSPSVFMFREVRAVCPLPIHVLIRPRFGDFIYSQSEVRVMLNEIQQFKDEGADGVVMGALNPEGCLDMKVMECICKTADNMSITLHRAFDMCKDPYDSLKKAKELKIDIILTSGQKKNCIDGSDLINQLVLRNQVQIMVCGGINKDTIRQLKAQTNATSFHLSGKKTVQSQMKYRNLNVNMGLEGFNEYESWFTCADLISEIREVLDNM